MNFDINQIRHTEAPPREVDDMTKLAYLHEPGVLNNLISRYDIDEFYMPTLQNSLPPLYLNVFILHMSSYQILLSDLYWKYIDCCESFPKASSFIRQKMAQYKGAGFDELSPRPFAVADAAYRSSEELSLFLYVLCCTSGGQVLRNFSKNRFIRNARKSSKFLERIIIRFESSMKEVSKVPRGRTPREWLKKDGGGIRYCKGGKKFK
ncbi:Myosin-14, partial [Mucuna pruriens]